MRKSIPLLIQTVVVSVILFSCAQEQEAKMRSVSDPSAVFDLNAAREIIQEKTRLFTEAHITRDTAYLHHIITEDARVFPPNSEIVLGNKAIAQLNTDWVNYGIHEFTETSIHFYGNENYLIDEGTYHLRYGEENTVDDGKYINIWQYVNGDWKICSNIWNTSMPLSGTE